MWLHAARGRQFDMPDVECELISPKDPTVTMFKILIRRNNPVEKFWGQGQ